MPLSTVEPLLPLVPPPGIVGLAVVERTLYPNPAGQGSDSTTAGSRRMRQPAWWCRVCGNLSLVPGSLCRACYDRRRRNEIYFGGFREQVFARDQVCRVCTAAKKLIVHHRRPGVNRPALQITLCVRCHVRLRRRLRLPGFYSDLFLELWRELHPQMPVQLRLPWSP